eukprot:12984654-Alexandrium_andersonii.AAC.1
MRSPDKPPAPAKGTGWNDSKQRSKLSGWSDRKQRSKLSGWSDRKQCSKLPGWSDKKHYSSCGICSCTAKDGGGRWYPSGSMQRYTDALTFHRQWQTKRQRSNST